MAKQFEIRSAEHVIVITLFDKSFSVFAQALQKIAKKYKDKKILMIQSKQEEDQPMKIVIVFEF